MSLFSALNVNAENTAEELASATEQVNSFLSSTEIARIRTYCVKGKDDCRTLVQRKDKVTGKVSKSFYDIFQSRDRKVGSTCYIIFDEKTNSYNVYSDLTFDSEVAINQVLPLNKNIRVKFNRSGYPTVTNLVLSKLGTPNGVIGTMAFDSKGSFVEGNQILLAEPSKLGDKVRIDYERID